MMKVPLVVTMLALISVLNIPNVSASLFDDQYLIFKETFTDFYQKLYVTLYGGDFVMNSLNVGTINANISNIINETVTDIKVTRNITVSGNISANYGFFDRVGIGTAIPSAPLDIYQISGPYIELSEFNGPVAYLGDFDAGQAGDLKLIDANGNVTGVWLTADRESFIMNDLGIGTATPQANRILTMEGSSDFAYYSIRTNGAENWTVGADIDGFVIYSDTDSAYRFAIDNEGKVGIGTNNPAEELDMNGGDIVMKYGFIFLASNTDRHAIVSQDETGTDNSSSVRVNSRGSIYLNLDANNDNSDNADFRIGHHGEGNLGTIESWYLTVQESSGNVGIGTVSPESPLHIKQSAQTNVGGIRIEKSNTAEQYYIYYTTGNDLQFGYTTAGDVDTDVMVLTNDAKVGIGTASPSNLLHVNSSTINKVAVFESTDSVALIEIKDNVSSATIGATGGVVKINNEADLTSNHLVIDSSGNVGIGTVSPGGNLHIFSSTDNVVSIIEGGANKNATLHLLEDGVGDVGAYLRYDGNANKFHIMTGNNPPVERMTFLRDSAGVGIGTVSPSNALDVETADNTVASFVSTDARGSIKISDSDDDVWVGTESNKMFFGFGDALANGKLVLQTDGNVGIGTATPNDLLNVETTGANDDTAIRIGIDTGNKWWAIENYGSGTGDFDAALRFNSNLGENILFLARGGNVGIGTDAPGQRLDVLSATNIMAAFRNANGQLQYQSDGTKNFIYSVNADNTGYEDFAIQTGATQGFWVQSTTGNVGIGTTIPNQKLQVIGGLNQTDGNATINMIYGEMWYHNHTATPLNFAVDGRFYNLTFDNSFVNGFTFNDSGDYMEAQYDGIYSTSYMASGDGQNNHIYFTTISVNGDDIERCESHKKMTAGGDVITMTGSCLLDLSVGDKVRLATADVGDTGIGNYYSANLIMVRIGD